MIVSAPVPANLAASKATSTIPIVMANGADPVSFGLVQSLSHPGGNVTGLTNFAEGLASKQIDIMRELLPHLARVGALINVDNPLHVPQWRETQAAAANASLALLHFDYRVPDDLERAFDYFTREKVEAVLVPPDVTFAAQRVRIAGLAANARLPTIYFLRESVVDGGLLSYGPVASQLGASERKLITDSLLRLHQRAEGMEALAGLLQAERLVAVTDEVKKHIEGLVARLLHGQVVTILKQLKQLKQLGHSAAEGRPADC